MKNKPSLIVPIILLMSSAAYAAGYLDRLRGIDQGVICLVVWFAPAIVVILFALGGFLYSTGDPANRALGKGYMLNSLAGLFLSVALVGLAFALVPTLKIDKCLGEAEKTCEAAGGKCGCPTGQVCKTGARVSDVTDCPDTCCKLCESKPVEEKKCEEYGSYVCGDCPAGKKCFESSAPGCEEGKKCCECVDEETCEKLGLTCGCDTAAGEICQPGTEKENVETCAKCCKCIKPCSGTFGTKCCKSGVGIGGLCSAEQCHADPGCQYISLGLSADAGYQRCFSCCTDSSKLKVRTCEDYSTKAACEDVNPCALSKGGWVPTDCYWTTCDLGATSLPCCKPK